MHRKIIFQECNYALEKKYLQYETRKKEVIMGKKVEVLDTENI